MTQKTVALRSAAVFHSIKRCVHAFLSNDNLNDPIDKLPSEGYNNIESTSLVVVCVFIRMMDAGGVP